MTCRVVGCLEERAPDAQVCCGHLTDLWAGRLDRQADGTYVRSAAPQSRPPAMSPFVRRALEHQLPVKALS